MDDLKVLNKGFKKSGAKSKALDIYKKYGKKTIGDSQSYSPGHGHGIDNGKKKPTLNKAKSNLLVSTENRNKHK